MADPTSLSLTTDQVRALRILAQGLPPAGKAKLLPSLERTGFVRTLGGADCYLGMRARVPSLRRQDLDAAVEASEAQVSPGPRGCIYLVARADVPLCLRIADQLSAGRALREHEKAGIETGEVEQVAAAVLKALRSKGPMTTDVLRKAMPEGTVRSLGERGKKVGISSPLPSALRQLEFAGKVERSPEEHRLDTERYLWRAAAKDPFAGAKLPGEPARLHALLLQRFIRFAGVGTLKDFCGWAGLAQRDGKAAVPHAELLPVAADGLVDAFAAPDAPATLKRAAEIDDAAALLPFEDNLVHLHGGPAWLVDPGFHALPVPNWGSGKPEPLGKAQHMAFRSVLGDGRLCGFWEYDPDDKKVVVQFFAPPSKAAQQRIGDEAERAAGFLRDELGHGHSFSLDTDDELRKRIGLLMKIGGGKARSTARLTKAAARRT
jgi:hypothetical protein